MDSVRRPLPAVVGSVVRSSLLCGLQLQEGRGVTPAVCCPLQVNHKTTDSFQPVPAPVDDLDGHPAAGQLGRQEACGVSLVYDPVDEIEGFASLGQFPWLAILGNATTDFNNNNNNCLGTLIGPQVLAFLSRPAGENSLHITLLHVTTKNHGTL